MITAEELVQELNNDTEQKIFKLGKVVELFENETAKVQFDGEDIPSEKQYAYLDSYIPQVDDRVLLCSVSDTYIILGKIKFDEPPSKPEEIDRYVFDEKKVSVEKGIDIEGGAQIDNLEADTALIKGDLDVEGDISTGNINAVGDVAVAGTANITGEMRSNSIYSGTTSLGNTNIRYSLNVQETLRHTGTFLGFFNATATGKKTVYNISNTANVTTESVANKVNEILNALRSYGLIGGY